MCRSGSHWCCRGRQNGSTAPFNVSVELADVPQHSLCHNSLSSKVFQREGSPQIRGLFLRLKPLHFNPLLGVLWQQACLAWKSPCWLASRPRVPFGFMWFVHTKCWWIEIYLGTEGFVGKLWGMRGCENYSRGLRLLEKILHPANNADTSQFLPLQALCFLLNKGLPRFPFTNLKNR